MQAPPLPFNPQAPSSSVTTTNSGPTFIETLEYRRFVEFCDACRRDRYIGLCFGPPGIGKTLSAWHYSRAELIVPLDRWSAEARDQKPIDTVLYTTSVINSPSRVEVELHRAREILSNIATRAIRTEARQKLDAMRIRDENWRKENREDPTYVPAQPPPFTPTYFQTFEEYEAKKRAIPDPTSLIVVDEADRLSMPSLEQLRSVFDQTGFGMVLIGMPGLEKRAARYPQFFSRIGFVHEFRALAAAEVQTLLEENWTALASGSLAEAPAPDVVAAIIRVTGGNFRLITRLLTQMERVFKINQLKHLSPAVVETARENLVIGQV
jgi:DNA transposition AAA+ family ATPase